MVRKAGNKQAMEAALQAAVQRMGNGAAPAAHAGTPAVDPMGLLMAALPKLLESRESPEDLDERLEELRKDELQPMRQHLVAQAELLERILRNQKVLLRKLREVEAVQNAIGGAVTHLTDQLARVELVEESEEADYPDAPPSSEGLGFDAALLRTRVRPKPRQR